MADNILVLGLLPGGNVQSLYCRESRAMVVRLNSRTVSLVRKRGSFATPFFYPYRLAGLVSIAIWKFVAVTQKLAEHLGDLGMINRLAAVVDE